MYQVDNGKQTSFDYKQVLNNKKMLPMVLMQCYSGSGQEFAACVSSVDLHEFHASVSFCTIQMQGWNTTKKNNM